MPLPKATEGKSLTDILHVKCPACSLLPDAYFDFEHGIGIQKDLPNGGTEHLEISADLIANLPTSFCPDCLKRLSPTVASITIGFTKDL